jgi:hypothetical protein
MKKGLMLMGLLLVWAGSAFGYENGRNAWFYSGGYFHKDDNSGGWAETINSQETFYFTEVHRTSDYVWLYDKTRKMNVKLYRDAMYLKGLGATQFTHFKNGGWDDRRFFYFSTAPGNAAYFQLVGGGMYRFFTREGIYTSVKYLRCTYRSDTVLHLLYPSTNTTYVVFMDTFVTSLGNGQYGPHIPGQWRN